MFRCHEALREKFGPDYAQKLVDEVNQHGITITAHRHHVHPSTINYWLVVMGARKMYVLTRPKGEERGVIRGLTTPMSPGVK